LNARFPASRARRERVDDVDDDGARGAIRTIVDAR